MRKWEVGNREMRNRKCRNGNIATQLFSKSSSCIMHRQILYNISWVYINGSHKPMLALTRQHEPPLQLQNQGGDVPRSIAS